MTASERLTRSPRDRRRWLSQQRRDDNRWLGFALASGILESLALTVQLGLMAWIIHALLTTDTRLPELAPRVSILLLMVLLRAAFQYLREHFSHQLSRRVRRRVQNRLLAGWGNRGPVALSGQTPAGLSTVLLEQVDALDGYYARYLPQAGLAFMTPLLILCVVLWLDWLAALFLFLSAPLIPLFMALVGMGAESLNQRHFTQLARLSGHFTDRIRNLTTLRLFGQTHAAREQIADASDQYRRLTMKTLRIAFLSSAVLEFFASVAIAVIAIYIGFGLLGYIEFGPSTELSLFSGLFILLLAPEFFQPLRLFAQHYHDRASALGAADHLLDHLAETGQDMKGTATRTRSIHSASPLVSSRAVRFRYPGRPPLLDSVSFDVDDGEWVALTGPSGSGKTTLLRLIAGFIDPDSGTLTVQSGSPEQFRFGWLDQHPFLAESSWRDSLTAGADRPLSDATLYRTLEMVGLRARIDAEPAGLDSLLHEQGYGLSGGQMRRLALARQFLAGHRLLLLDEPTAGLDPDSEQLILQVLDRLNQQGCTLVMVSHHQRSIHRAHRVLDLQGGRLHAR